VIKCVSWQLRRKTLAHLAMGGGVVGVVNSTVTALGGNCLPASSRQIYPCTLFGSRFRIRYLEGPIPIPLHPRRAC